MIFYPIVYRIFRMDDRHDVGIQGESKVSFLRSWFGPLKKGREVLSNFNQMQRLAFCIINSIMFFSNLLYFYAWNEIFYCSITAIVVIFPRQRSVVAAVG